MATHSTSSFDESEEVRILSGFLESKRTIKTFFKENDRTPNHDGNFELINDDKTPKKQFIVQIKKVENLQPNIQGKNKGKYVYSLDTAFLYYVKEKVTESPAIYFVVDIITKDIFWLYLSDELLMSLNFEQSGELHSYGFSETDKVTNIDDFTKTLNKISQERNALFIEKTPEEISEIQDAVEYLNNYMNNDFVKIKEVLFPNLWRFGLRHSITSEFSITIREKTVKPENTAVFALYPQIKGGRDTGIQTFQGHNDKGFFTSFDLSGKKKPLEYSKESLEKIIKSFFENEHAFIYFPSIAISEKLSIFAKQLGRIFPITDSKGKIMVQKVYRGFFWVLKYIESIILNHPQTEEELALNKAIGTSLRNRGKKSCDFIFWCTNYGCDKHFYKFCQTNNVNEMPRFSLTMLDFVKAEHIRAFLMASQLQERQITYLDTVWDYNYYELTQLEGKQFIQKIDDICSRWLSLLPDLYNETFDKLFDKNKYRFCGRFEYKNVDCREGHSGPWLSNIIHEYNDNNFSLTYNANITEDFTDENKSNGLKSVHSGLIFERLLQRQTPIYDSLTCLLYEGVCKGLGIKAHSLSMNHDSIRFL